MNVMLAAAEASPEKAREATYMEDRITIVGERLSENRLCQERERAREREMAAC